MTLTVEDIEKLKRIVAAEANAMLAKLQAEQEAIAKGIAPPPNDPSWGKQTTEAV